jgi:hypothetical protein
MLEEIQREQREAERRRRAQWSPKHKQARRMRCLFGWMLVVTSGCFLLALFLHATTPVSLGAPAIIAGVVGVLSSLFLHTYFDSRVRATSPTYVRRAKEQAKCDAFCGSQDAHERVVRALGGRSTAEAADAAEKVFSARPPKTPPKKKHRSAASICAYCGRGWREDSDGACKFCGAPASKGRPREADPRATEKLPVAMK